MENGIGTAAVRDAGAVAAEAVGVGMGGQQQDQHTELAKKPHFPVSDYAYMDNESNQSLPSGPWEETVALLAASGRKHSLGPTVAQQPSETACLIENLDSKSD